MKGMKGQKGAPAPGENSIAYIAIDAGFSELVEALQYVDGELETGLVELFSEGTDQYTVFGPTNDAFEDLYALLTSLGLGDALGLPSGEIDEIADLPAGVVLDVLLYHVTEGRRASNSVLPKKNPRIITPLLGETFKVRSDGTIEDGLTGVRPSDAAIETPNISASNGIIHVIDAVIVPPSVVGTVLSLISP